MRIVLLTGSELRHEFVRRVFWTAPGVELALSVQEGAERSLRALVESREQTSEVELQHVEGRARSEQDFFGSVVRCLPDAGPYLSLPKGGVNDTATAERIRDAGADLLCAYGCSIVREPLLSLFPRRFLNVHLGLSPYYRGSGTNFWPLVEGKPEFVGATFMYIDAGVDTGEVIHQIRARVYPGDSPHQIGNRLIQDAAHVYVELARRFDEVQPQAQIPAPADSRYCRNRDFSQEATAELYRRFESGLVGDYLARREEAEARSPIVRQPFLSPSASAQPQ